MASGEWVGQHFFRPRERFLVKLFHIEFESSHVLQVMYEFQVKHGFQVIYRFQVMYFKLCTSSYVVQVRYFKLFTSSYLLQVMYFQLCIQGLILSFLPDTAR